MDFDPSKPFEVVDAPPFDPTKPFEPAAGFDPSKPFEAAPPATGREFKPSPYDRFVLESAAMGTRNAEELGNADFLTAVGKDPLGFLKSLPNTAGSLMAAPGTVAYYQAADAVSKLFGDPKYGGNIQAMEQGKDVLPADAFVAEAAKTNPNMAVTAKLGQAATEMAPTLGLAAAPAAVNRLLAAGFSAQMIAHAPELFEAYANETAKPEGEQDAGKLADLKAQMVQTFVFAPLAGAGATHGIETPAIDRFVPRGTGLRGTRPVQAFEPPDPATRSAAMEAAAQMPERPETLAAQLDWLTQDKRKAVLVTPGADLPTLPEGTELHPTDAGTFIFHPDRTSPEEIDRAVAENKIGDLLDYGIADKPAPAEALGVVTIRDANGIEKQAVLTDQEHLPAVLAKAKARADATDTVQMETPEQVIAGRQAPERGPVETPTMRMAREQREAMAALRSQTVETPPPTAPALDPNAPPGANGIVKDRSTMGQSSEAPPEKLKPVEISADDYKAARQGNSPFMEVSTATGLAKEMKRAQEFSATALTERPGETEPRPVPQLFVGDQFQVGGQPVHVAEWVTDAETGEPAGVNIDGAYGRQFVPADATLHIDAGTMADPVETWFDKAIAATSPVAGAVLEGVTGAPVWMTKAAINGALKLAKFAYTRTRDISRSVGEAVRFLKAQKLEGFNEAEALDWLESNLRGEAIVQNTGRAIGAATEERRPLENTSAAQQMSGSNITTLPHQRDLLSAVTGIGWRQRTAGWIGGLAGETFPRTTRALRELGEQGARWIASRAAAIPLADSFSEDVTRGLQLDDVEFGAALHEDNLRSIKQSQLDHAAKMEAAGDTEAATKWRAMAQRVFTFVGQGGVFPDEASYQEYLAKPTVQAALQRHIGAWRELVDPVYREAMQLDPDLELPARGLQTGARINLNFVREGEAAGPGVFVGTAAPKGVLANVLQRRSPFGRMAKGTAEAYRPSYQEAMRNTYARQLEISNRNKFDRMMVESGNAVIDKPGKGKEIKIGGEGVTDFPIKRTVLQIDGQRIPKFENIYVRKSLAGEYRSALNLEAEQWTKVAAKITKLSNISSLAGLAEVTAHLSNQAHTLLLRPGVTRNFWSEIGLSALGRADAIVAVGRALMKLGEEDHVRIRELSEIGAMREVHTKDYSPISQRLADPTNAMMESWHRWASGPVRFVASRPRNPFKWGGLVLEWGDIHTRLQLDRMYQNLAEQDLVPKTETARREFVNQVGQYNRRAQGSLVRTLRDSGIGPFVTAGRAMKVLYLRTAMFSPGVETTSWGDRAAVAATMASKFAGTLFLVGTLNYVLTHKKGGGVAGRKGVPWGAVDLGVDDKNKRPMYIDLLALSGWKGAARVTGLRGGAEALRYHLPIGTVMQSSMRDIINSGISPAVGPAIRTASIAITGKQPAIGVPRTAPVVPPGQNQFVQNAKTAAMEMNPVIAGIHDSKEPGATGMELWQRQMGRFSIQPGKPPEMAQGNKYPRIVARAQASEFINDVIMRARKMQGAERLNYVRDAINQLDPRDREHAKSTLIQRGILPRPPSF